MFDYGGNGASASHLSRLILLTNNKPFCSVAMQFEINYFTKVAYN